MLGAEDVRLRFTDDGIEEMSRMAVQANRTSQNIGARRLYTILEKVLEDVSFRASELTGQEIKVDAAYVRQRLAEVLKSEDLSKYIL
jgi:ATP-dependent HslUV protease ATP-binding subunit HslU